MSSNGYELPLHLNIKVSRQLRLCLLLAHIWMMLVIMSLAVSITVKILFLAIVLASLCYYLFRARANATHLPISVLMKDSGRVLAEFSDGESKRAQIRGDSYLHPWLVILNLKFVEGGALSIPLLRDSLAGDQHRQLRMYLRLQQYRLNTKNKRNGQPI